MRNLLLLTTASAQCLRLSERFFHFVKCRRRILLPDSNYVDLPFAHGVS